MIIINKYNMKGSCIEKIQHNKKQRKYKKQSKLNEVYAFKDFKTRDFSKIFESVLFQLILE